MKGTRENWAKWIPIIEAFVDGQAIQRKTSFSKGQWHDTDELYGLVSGYEFRVKPKNSQEGVWRIDYLVNLESDITGFGTLSVKGLSDDEIVWPEPHRYLYQYDSVRFIPYGED